MMRIGLFGGTFDPIHIGHLRAALEVQQAFDLDRVFIIPANLPPHKKGHQVTDAADRLKMVELGVSGYSGFSVSDVELLRSGPSYSIDTINHFKTSSDEDTEIFFISGLDAFLEIDTWKSYKELLRQIAFIVIARPRFDCSDVSSRWKRLEDFIMDQISADYEFSEQSACFIHSGAKPIYIFDVTPLDISSTRIRELVKSGQPITYLVPESVENYVKRRGLYS
jgi:nicotinate-nucleotide adenylyltransferase